MKLIIGCPIYDRAWILPLWLDAIQKQSINLSDVGFVFAAAENDTSTIDILNKWKSFNNQIELFDIFYPQNVNHFSHEDGTRHWTISKYENMVNLRNQLLSRVRSYQPDYFFSLDSDIIIKNPSTIELLVAHIKDGADAVNPLMFMTPAGSMFPSVMTWESEPGGKAHRNFGYPLGTYFKADVIMAAKMMSKDVYNNVSYEIHAQGEDLGWSSNCAKQGFNLYCASYIYAIHVMHKRMLQDVIQNGDPREEITIKGLSKV